MLPACKEASWSVLNRSGATVAGLCKQNHCRQVMKCTLWQVAWHSRMWTSYIQILNIPKEQRRNGKSSEEKKERKIQKEGAPTERTESKERCVYKPTGHVAPATSAAEAFTSVWALIHGVNSCRTSLSGSITRAKISEESEVGSPECPLGAACASVSLPTAPRVPLKLTELYPCQNKVEWGQQNHKVRL